MSIFTTQKEQGIVTILIDDKSSSQNTLKMELVDEFQTLINEIENDSSIKGVIFTSAKENNFIAGADINMLQTIESAQEGERLSALLQAMTVRIENLKPITVAAINGACMGGGLELAMAFDYRVASDHKSVKLGLPEVQLGLLPGGSGTQRISRLIDLPTALDLLLTGKALNGKRSLNTGLVDAVVAPQMLLSIAEQFVAKGKPEATNSLKSMAMDNSFARRVIFNQALKKTLKTTRGNFPAPEKILKVVEYGLNHSFEEGLAAEAKAFGELVVTPESKQFIEIFFATTDLKKDTGVDTKVSIKPINKVGVIGAGLMGAGIASVSVEKAGLSTRIKDIDAKNIANGIKYVGKILDKKVSRRHISVLRRNQTMAKLTGSKDYSGFAKMDVVIEAVFESLALKQSILADIEKASKVKTIFASNTSAIPIDDIAAKAKHPERVIGMHYFSPVEKMPLLEVVNGSKTADWVTATAVELGKQQGKTVIVVNDGPGFYTTRILVPFIMEAMRLVMEGVSIEDVDSALEQFGFPVGPIKLMDEVGIDVGAHIVETLNKAFGERVPLIEGVDELLGDNRHGRKNSKGFYLYENGKSLEVDQSVYQVVGIENAGGKQMSEQEIVQRCVLTMINEAAFCLGENILRSVRDGDIGAVFGLGFPPFLGGPFRYMDSTGIDQMITQLHDLQVEYGDRYSVAPILLEMQKNKKTFY